MTAAIQRHARGGLCVLAALVLAVTLGVVAQGGSADHGGSSPHSARTLHVLATQYLKRTAPRPHEAARLDLAAAYGSALTPVDATGSAAAAPHQHANDLSQPAYRGRGPPAGELS